MRSSILIVGAGALATAACQFFLIRLYASRFGPEDMSAYLVFRVWGSVVFAFAALGMPVALQRTVAFWSGSPARAGTAAVVGIGLGATSLGFVLFLSAAFANQIAGLMGYPPAAPLWQSFTLLILLQTITGIVGYVQQARGRTLEATVTAFAYGGLAPLTALWLLPASSTLPEVLLWTGVLGGLVGIPSLLEIVRWAGRNGCTDPWDEASRLLRYGLPRTVTSGLEILLEAAVPWFALSLGAGLAKAGPLALGLALVRLLNPIGFTLNQVFVPSSASLAAKNEPDKQSMLIGQVAEGVVHIGFFITVQMVCWCDWLVKMWVGDVYDDGISIVRVMVVSMAPVFVFISIRGILDGAMEYPVVTVHLLCALALLVTLSASSMMLGLGEMGLAFSYLAARTVLGGMSLRAALRLHGTPWSMLRWPYALGLSLLLGLVTLTARSFLETGWIIYSLPILSLFSGVVFVLGMAAAGAQWAGKIQWRCR